MVTLKTLEVEGLFGVRGKTSVDLDGQGLVVVRGNNGSGKTSLFIESITYVLYGMSFMYGARPGAAVVNRHHKGGKSGYGTIVLDANGTTYRITRSHGVRGRRPVTLEEAVGDGGWRDLTMSKGTQGKIDGVLGMGVSAFTHSVMFSSRVARFPDMSDGDRKAVLDGLTEMGGLDAALAATKARISTLTAAVADAEAGLGRARAVETTVSAELAEAEEAGKGWADARDAELAALVARAQERRDRAAQFAAARAGLEKGAAEAAADAAQARKLAEAAKADLAQAREATSRSSDALRKADAALASARAAAREATRRVEEAEALVARGTCPTCEGDTTGGPACDRVPGLVREAAERGMAEEAAAKKAKEAAAWHDRMKEAEREAIKADDAAADDLEEAREVARRAANAASANELSYSSAREAFVTARDAAREKADETNPHTSRAERLERAVADAAGEVARLGEARDRAAQELADEDIIMRAVGGKGARLLVIERIIPVLNAEAERLAAIIGTPMRVSFSVREDGESFAGQLRVDVEHPNGASTYDGCSDGERRRADMLMLLALLQLAMARGRRAFRQAFFDEAFESLDELGEEAMMAAMRDVARHCTSVFSINHNADRVSSGADQVWEMSGGALVR